MLKALVLLATMALTSVPMEVREWSRKAVRPLTRATAVQLASSASVIAMGEAAHGGEEALSVRNRLIRYLVESGQVHGVALETGFAEARWLDAFVQGGPGDARAAAEKGFTSGFGNFAANAELIQWLRGFNATRARKARVRVYGYDLSLIGPCGSAPSAGPVECALEGVPKAAERTGLRQEFTREFEPAFSQNPLTTADRNAAYTASVARLGQAVVAPPDGLAARCATVAAQAGAVLETLPQRPMDDQLRAGIWRTIEAGDRAMAHNVLWAMRDLGPGKRLFVFGHNSHILNEAMRGGQWANQTKSPRSMGQALKQALGRRLVIMAQLSSPDRQPDRNDDLLRTIGFTRGEPRLLDFRRAPVTVAQFLGRPASIRSNDTSATIDPNTALDVAYHGGAASPARMLQ